MTRFRFGLERLLQLREGLERQRAADLGRALAAERRRQVELEDAERRLAEARSRAANEAARPAPAGTLHVRSQVLRAAADQVDAAGERAREAGDRSDAEREGFEAARRDRESLARLREHRHETWRVESSRQEQKDVDEIARRRREEGEKP